MMIDVSKEQAKFFSKDPSAHISISDKDTEKYVDKVANSYHRARRKDWHKQYKINYKNRREDQIKKRKSGLD